MPWAGEVSWTEGNAPFCTERENMREEAERCPRCGVKVDREARYCSNCRSVLRVDVGLVREDFVAGEEYAGELIPLTFHLEDVRTVDPVKIDVTVRIVVLVVKRDRFLEHVAHGEDAPGTNELHDFLREGVYNAFRDMLGKRSIKELESDGAGSGLRKEFEVRVEHYLKNTLDAAGLYLNELKSVEYDFRNYSGVIDAEEKGFIRNEMDEVEAKELEKRILMRRKTLSLLGDLSLSDDKIEEYLLEEEKAKLLRSRELEDLKAALEERDMDRKTKRDWIIRKLELDQELDYERRKLLGKAGIDREVAEARYAVIEVEAGIERLRLENEIADQKVKNLAEIEMTGLKEESNLKAMGALIELKKKKDRDAIENELFREKEQLEMRLREKEIEAGLPRATGVPTGQAAPEAGTIYGEPSSPGKRDAAEESRDDDFVTLRCVNPGCNTAFSVKAGDRAAMYRCPKCSGRVMEQN